MSLSYSKILQHTHQLVVDLLGTLFHMCKSGQFYPHLTWVIPLRFAGVNVSRVTSIWRIEMDPHDIKMKDILKVFFDTISSVPKNALF